MPDARAISALMVWPDAHTAMARKAMTKLFTR
jgi:hypothetical protein